MAFLLGYLSRGDGTAGGSVRSRKANKSSHPSPPQPVRQNGWPVDLCLAVVISAILSISGIVREWDDLSSLILPTADDMVRLAQIRDWLAGQAFNDWTQYRMGPVNGAPMHWSRLADFGPASIIALLTPSFGKTTAEIVAVLLWPSFLFAGMMVVNARIARTLWHDPRGGPIAVLLTALAYPGTIIFAPGRIDHHGLQAVGIGLAILALLRPPSSWSGVLLGLALATSLMIGLETLPHAAVLVAVAILYWVIDGFDERPRLIALGCSLGGGTAFFTATMRPTLWSAEWCDAFTPASATALLTGGIALVAMGVASKRLATWRSRACFGALGGTIAASITFALYPSCAGGPYEAVHPFLRQNFFTTIDEAVSVFSQQSVSRILSLLGLSLTASLVGILMLARGNVEWRPLLPIAAIVGLSTAIMFVQLRGVYIGAPLAPPILTGLVLLARSARRFSVLALIAGWTMSAGTAYLEIPRMAAGSSSRSALANPQRLCRTDTVWPIIDRHPNGTIMAPVNMAAYILGATNHRTVGAGYHRNDAGTMAMYRFFLGPSDQAMRIARVWQVDYVAFCPGDFREQDLVGRYPNSIAAMLDRDEMPPNFERLPLRDARLRLYRIDP